MISRSVSTRSRRASRGVTGTASISCAAKAMPTATTGFIARSVRDGHVVVARAVADAVAAAVEGEQRHEQDVGRDLGRLRLSARGCPSGRTSSGSPNAKARMISGLPRPATTGSASCAPAPRALRISGSGLISLFSGDEAGDDRAGRDRDRKRPRRDRLGGPGALGRRQRVAPRSASLRTMDFSSEMVIRRRRTWSASVDARLRRQ